MADRITIPGAVPTEYDQTGIAPTPAVNPAVQDLQQIQGIMDAGPDARALLNLARERDNTLATNNQMLIDRKTLERGDFRAKYGNQAVDTLDKLDLGKQPLQDLKAGENNLTVADDLRSLVKSLNTGLGSTVVSGARLLDTSGELGLGTHGAELMDQYSKWAGKFQSTNQKKSNLLSGMRTGLDRMDNNSKSETYSDPLGKTISTLTDLGRDALSGVGRMAEAPGTLETGIAEGVGSVLAAGPTARGLALLGKAATGLAVTTEAVVPLSIGLQEGGSAYVGNVNEVMNTSDADLMKNSPDYRNMVNSGVPKDEAKRRVADKAGVIAGAIQGPLGGLAGNLVSKFEAAPLGVASLRDAAQNIAKETLEETIQSGTGQLAQNVGIKVSADENKNVLEDVGSQAAQGGILGGLSAGVIQSPSTALSEASKLVGKGVTGIKERGQRIREANEAASPVSTPNITAAVQTASENAPAVAEAVRTLATEAKAPTEDTEQFINRVVGASTVTPEELQVLPERMRNSLEARSINNRFDVIDMASKIANTEAMPAQDRAQAATFLMDQIKNNEKLFNEDVPEFLNNVPHDNENYAAFQNYSNVIKRMQDNPAVKAAMTWAEENMTATDPADVTSVSGVARHAPQNMDPNVADQVLLQADNGDIELDPIARKNIQAASSLMKSAQLFNDQMNKQEQAIDPEFISDATDYVSGNIAKNDGPVPYKLSAESHVRRIAEANATGDTKALKTYMTDFALFARHMRNKAQAFNESFQNNGAPVTFQSLGADHKWLPEGKRQPVRAYPTKAKSLALARRVHAEATAMADLANRLNKIYPEYATQDITVAPLDQRMLRAVAEDTSRQVDPVEQVDVSPPSTSAPEVVKAVDEQIEPVVEIVAEVTPEPIVQEETPAPVVEDKASEPKVEVTVSDASKEPEAVSEPLRDNYDDKLVETTSEDKTKKESFFKKTFRKGKTPKSRINQMTYPLQDVTEMLDDNKKLTEFRGKELDYKISEDNRSAMQSLIDLGKVALGEVEIRLVDLFEKKKDGKGNSLKDLMLKGEPVARYVRGRMLNILDRNNDDFSYNSQLMETAVLAGVDWAINSQARFAKLDKADVAALMGIDESSVTDQNLIDFNRGISVSDAKNELAQKIVSFWGLDKNKSASIAYTRGISEGVAAEIIKGLEEAGFLTTGKLAGYQKDFGRVFFDERSDEMEELIRSVGPASDLLSDIMTITKQKTVYIGSPPTEVATKQLRSPMVNNTSQARKAIEQIQNTPFYPNVVVHDFIKAMGMIPFVELLGGQNYEEGELNINHESSVNGKNRTLMSSYKGVLAHMEKVKAHGGVLEDTPTFYEANMTRVGRLQLLGLNNPQADKFAREIFMPTKSNLDMTDPMGSDAKKFWMTVGQGFGIKTEKLSRDQVMTDALKLANGDYKNIITKLEAWLDTRHDLPIELVNEIRDAMGSKLSMHGIHSLLSVAQYQKAIKENKLTDFTHYNYLEADGKTNGPINSLMLFATGKFTNTWLKLVGKGGFYVNEQDKSLNDHIQNEDNADLYQEVTKLFSQYQKDYINHVAQNSKPALAQFKTLLRVMSALNVDVTFSEDTDGNITLNMERGVAKNPLTISIYGSGQDGIAGKITNELINTIYEKFSEFNAKQKAGTNMTLGDFITDKEGNPYGTEAFNKDLESLINQRPVVDKDTGEITLSSANGDEKGGIYNSAREFTFSQRDFNNLKGNIRLFFVQQMDAAIREGVLGNVDEATTAVQQATHVQSIFLTTLFHNELAARLYDKKKNKPDNYRDGDFFSEDEMAEIYKNLEAYSPIIETGTQNFFLSGKESADLFDPVVINGVKVNVPDGFSRALSDDLSSIPTVFGPTLAGVRGVPSLVIGSGDGQMIQYIMAQFKLNGLPVFDGFNMPANKIDEYGAKVNEAVYKTWFENNPLGSVSKSFKSFMRNAPLESLMGNNPFNIQKDFFIQEMSKVIFETRKPKRMATMQEISDYMKSIDSNLDRLQDEVSIRQEVLKRFSMSIDQMASAESPYSRKGQVIDGDIVTALNNAYNEIAAERTNNQNAPIEPVNAALVSTVNSLGNAIPIENMDQVLDTVDLSPIHSEMMKYTLKSLEGSGYTVVFGTPNELAAYQKEHHPDRYDPSAHDAYGKTDPITKTVYISNISGETLVHELIHAATIEKTIAFYKNPKSLSNTDRDAFERLEGLMNEWIAQDYSNEDAPTQEARRQAISTINQYLNSNKPVQALNEFMAWNLSNQNLIEVLKNTKVKNALYRIAQKAYQAIKQLIWGTKFAIPVSDTMFSNLRFNTRVIMSTPTRQETLSQDLHEVALYQSASFGSSNYLSELRDRFDAVITTYVVNGDPTRQLDRESIKSDALVKGGLVADSFAAHGFAMNMQEMSTFSMIQATLMTEADLNGPSLARLQTVYADVMSKLSPSSFVTDENDPADVYQAQEKYDVLNGLYYVATDESGRSSLLSSFLALSMVHPEFRSVLNKMEKPKVLKGSDKTVDQYLTNFGNAAMDNLAQRLAGENIKDDNVLNAIDALTDNLIDNVGDQRSFIEQTADSKLDKGDKIFRDYIQNTSAKIINKTNQVVNNASNPVVAGGARVIRLLATFVNEAKSEQMMTGIVQFMNQTDHMIPLRELISDLVGRTKENATVIDMINKVRTTVQQSRQQFREKLPELLQSKFSRPVTDDEQTLMFNGIAKTDLAVLRGSLGISGALEMLTDHRKLRAETIRLENVIKANNPARFAMIQKKAKELAVYMDSGIQAKNLLRNAYAVAHLFGESQQQVNGAANAIVDSVDQLITLYAIDRFQSNNFAANTLANFIDNEKDGTEFLLSYLVGARSGEMSKVQNDLSKVNHYKGHFPSENQLGVNLAVISDSNSTEMLEKGYIRLGDYNGSTADNYVGSRSYWFTPVSGRAVFNQGVLQTVHQTVSGIDPNTGFTTGELTAGRIDDPQKIALTKRALRNSSATYEHLLPVYDDLGNVIAYERAVNPNMLHSLNRNTNIMQMTGAWSGRQVEELFAQEFNRALVDNLHDIWQKGRSERRTNEFVDISTSTDPVHQDAYKLIPNDLKDYINTVFGNDGFRITRSMINDSVGYRSASIGDLWSGNSRLKPAYAEALKNFLMGLFGTFGNGNKAYSYLTKGESVIQNVVGDAKVLIVVKSMVIPAANIVSNVFQLINRGVPARNVIKGLGQKAAEVNSYIISHDKELKLKAELFAAEGKNDTVAIRKIKTELQSISDSHKRMSIYPLIEVGEFTSISDNGVTQEDLALADGKWGQFAEKIANRLPDSFKTPAKYALITKDTALFQGLTRTVQYGDFLAKAILYDDLTKRKGVSKKEAIAQISEEYVNYNRLAGRTRQYLESIGLLWFYNFKLRIAKIGVQMARNHPLRTLMMAGMPWDFGSPIADNAISMFANGKLGWSIGPGMGMNAFQLSPWVQIAR